MFALRTIEVEGAPGDRPAGVVQALDETHGTSLVSLDGDAVIRRLEALPSVQSVTYDRAFPHTLRLDGRAGEAGGRRRQASTLWIVSVRGTVIGRTTAADRAQAFPAHPIPAETPLAAGQFVSDEGTKTVLAALGEAPQRMPLPIHGARIEDGELTMVLAGEGDDRPLLLLGEPSTRRPSCASPRLFCARRCEERDALTYLDVTLPLAPSGLTLKSQVELRVYLGIFPANTRLTYLRSGRTLRRTLKVSLGTRRGPR